MKPEILNRREFFWQIFKNLSVISLGGSLIGSFISSCRLGSRNNTQELENLEKAPNLLLDNFDSCPNTDNLTKRQISRRKRLKYTDLTHIANRRCNNCKLYITPKTSSPCGTCTLVPGPIHPKGWCISWYARM